MSNELSRFLTHVDSVLELVKPVYEIGERTAVYFTLLNKFDIDESEAQELQQEIMKRDTETPAISYYQNKAYTVIISNPWTITEDGTITRTVNENDDRECVVNNLWR